MKNYERKKKTEAAGMKLRLENNLNVFENKETGKTSGEVEVEVIRKDKITEETGRKCEMGTLIHKRLRQPYLVGNE